MKYGVISYAGRPMRPKGTNRVNLGDPIQSFAMEYIYEQMGVSLKDLIYVSRYNAKNYDGEYVLLPFNSFNRIINQLGHPYCTLPPSPKIIPLFISFHLHSRVIPDEILMNLRAYQPIGCRDEETMINLRAHGIVAYLSGCATALLPRRTITPSKQKVFFIDVPETVIPYIPKHLLVNAEFVTHHTVLPRTSDDEIMTEDECNIFYEMSKQQYERYRQDATLIVTSRLHAASPCMAMGIPVILVSDNFDGRFSWLDKFLPLYTPDLFHTIHWSPSPIDYETEKQELLALYKDLLYQSFHKAKQQYEVSSFFEARHKTVYNHGIIHALLSLSVSKEKNIRYAVWGLTTQALRLINVIKDVCPSWELFAAIDSTCNGTFEGVNVVSSSRIVEFPQDILVFLIPSSVHKTGAVLLNDLNRSYCVVGNDSMVYNCAK